MSALDVLVRGDGIVGRSLALALAHQGLDVGLTPPRSAQMASDVRCYALTPASVRLLQELKVWASLAPQDVTAVTEMRVHGDDLGAEALRLTAWQQGVSELAFIVDAAALHRVLGDACRYAPQLRKAEDDEPAALVALCEGKQSEARAALGVHMSRHAYDQTAIAARLTSTEAHNGVAWQWFSGSDVLALLPLDSPQPGASYALVWSLPAQRAQTLQGLDATEFAQELQAAVDAGDGPAGLVLATDRAAWPLTLATASAFSGQGWVLLGDAAHVVHPLAGQGLNLGLADVGALVRVLRGREAWRALGDPRLLRRYSRARALPTWEMGRLTDGLFHLFAAESSVVRELRNRGLTLVNHLPGVKRALVARALNT